MSALAVSLRKEVRAVWVVWAACALAMVALAAIDDPQVTMPGRYLYVLGSVAIVALSIGHEYTLGTLPVMLTLPSPRRSLLAGKLLAVTPMLATLAVLTLAFALPTAVQVATVLCAIALAPWLTMVCRSPLAGTVFAIGLAGEIHFLADVTAVSHAVLLGTLLAVAGGAAVATGWTFLRLEAGGGRGAAYRIGKAAAVARDRSRWLLLVMKELRLQQMSFAVAALYVLLWVGYAFANHVPEARGALDLVTTIYSALLAVLIGSIPSAEERQLQTIDWHALLPVATWKQWVIKAGITASLALLLSFALPLLLGPDELELAASHAVTVIFVTAASLYVSSLCASAARAFAIAAPVLMLVTLFLASTPPASELLATLVVLAGMTHVFAYVNHRSAQRDARRVVQQLLAMTVVAAIGVLAWR